MHGKSDHSQEGAHSQESYLLTANFFLFFSDSTVLRILDAVRGTQMTCHELAAKLGISSRIALEKLQAMACEGIVISHVRSKNTSFSIAQNGITQALEQILEIPKKAMQSSRGAVLDPAGKELEGAETGLSKHSKMRTRA